MPGWHYPSCCGSTRETWRCKSSTGPVRGTVSQTARVFTARWNLKEAAGKTLVRRTGIAYEAVARGEKAYIFKARYLHGMCGRKCGGHKREGRTSYPGISALLPCATVVVRRWNGSAEVSRGHSSWSNSSPKGRTCQARRTGDSTVLRQMPLEKGPEDGSSGRNPQGKAGRHKEQRR